MWDGQALNKVERDVSASPIVTGRHAFSPEDYEVPQLWGYNPVYGVTFHSHVRYKEI